MSSYLKTVPVLKPQGSIVGSKITSLSEGVLALLSMGYSLVLIDMGEISFVSKQTLESFVSLSTRFSEAEGYLGFANPTEVVRNLISLRRSERHMNFFYTTLEAEAHIIEAFGDVDFVYVSDYSQLPAQLADEEAVGDDVETGQTAGLEGAASGESPVPDDDESLDVLSAMVEEETDSSVYSPGDNVAPDEYDFAADGCDERSMDLDEIIDREILGEEYEDGFPGSETSEPRGFSYTDAISTVYEQSDDSPSIDFDQQENDEDPRGDLEQPEADVPSETRLEEGRQELLSMSDDELSDMVKAHNQPADGASFDYILEPDPLSDTTGKHKIPDNIEEIFSSRSRGAAHEVQQVEDDERIFPTGQINAAPFELVSAAARKTPPGVSVSHEEVEESVAAAIEVVTPQKDPVEAFSGRSPQSGTFGLRDSGSQEIPSENFDVLMEKIRSTNPRERWYGVRSLGRLGDTRGIAVLQSMLKKKKDYRFILDMAKLSLSRLERLYNPMSR